MFRLFRSKTSEEDEVKRLAEREAPVCEYMRLYQNKIESLIDKMEFKKEAGEVLPPWMMRVHPFKIPGMDELGFKSNVWHLHYWYWKGDTGGVYREKFYDFFLKLDLKGKIDYFRKYDLGPEWDERAEWAIAIFDSEAENMGEREWEKMIDALLGETQRT